MMFINFDLSITISKFLVSIAIKKNIASVLEFSYVPVGASGPRTPATEGGEQVIFY